MIQILFRTNSNMIPMNRQLFNSYESNSRTSMPLPRPTAAGPLQLSSTARTFLVFGAAYGWLYCLVTEARGCSDNQQNRSKQRQLSLTNNRSPTYISVRLAPGGFNWARNILEKGRLWFSFNSKTYSFFFHLLECFKIMNLIYVFKHWHNNIFQ